MNNQIRRLAICGIAALASIAATKAGSAQQQVLRAPDQIRTCLCMQQSLAHQASELTARQQDYEAQRRQVEKLDADVASQRPQVQVNNTSSVAAFRQLLARRDAAQQNFANTVEPQYAALVEAYDRRVAAFNQSCGGSAYDPNVLAQVQQSLACPPE
jgi:anti-sigma-K factor RskA